MICFVQLDTTKSLNSTGVNGKNIHKKAAEIIANNFNMTNI